MRSFSAFFREIESKDFWLRLAPWLHIGLPSDPVLSVEAGPSAPPSPPIADDWAGAGYLRVPSLLDPALTLSLARAVATLRSHELHPTFVYVYDEAWRVVDGLRSPLARLLGDDFDLLADVWAWHIDPQIDRGGWPIHRGAYDDVRDATGSPSLLNVWIALTDATEQNACIKIVPLSRDPHYPGDLHNLTSLGNLAVPLPTPAGSALVWSANAAHWGGECDPTFHHPRISISFTARRRTSLSFDPPALHLPLSFRQRLDLIAEQFETYGDKELASGSPEMRYAAMLREMREAWRRGRAH